MIRIVIVDSQEGYRNYLYEYLSKQNDFEVAGLGADSYEAIKLVEVHKPNIVLMEMNLPQGDGLKTAALIKYRSPHTSVIISGDDKERRIFSAFSSDISGYITKQADSELLCHAIRAVYCGGSLVSPEIVIKFRSIANNMAGKILKSRGELRTAQFGNGNQSTGKYSGNSSVERPRIISPSEIQIMGFLGQGCTNREIAEKLHLSEGTIRNYVSSLLQKTGFRDRTQMAIYAIKTGL